MALLAGLLLTGISQAAVGKEVHFAPGKKSALKQSVIRGKSDQSTLAIRQWLALPILIFNHTGKGE
jgi:hypothetical protein